MRDKFYFYWLIFIIDVISSLLQKSQFLSLFLLLELFLPLVYFCSMCPNIRLQLFNQFFLVLYFVFNPLQGYPGTLLYYLILTQLKDLCTENISYYCYGQHSFMAVWPPASVRQLILVYINNNQAYASTSISVY